MALRFPTGSSLSQQTPATGVEYTGWRTGFYESLRTPTWLTPPPTPTASRHHHETSLCLTSRITANSYINVALRRRELAYFWLRRSG